MSLVDEFEQYYRPNGIDWGSADIICAGPAGADMRFKELAEVLLGLSTEAISRFVIIMPPSDLPPPAKEESARQTSEAATPRLDVSLSEAKGLERVEVKMIRSPDRRAQSLLAILEEAELQSVILIREAAEYRSEGVQPFSSEDVPTPTLQEDFWAPQLHALAEAVVLAIRQRKIFVILDAGKLSPHREPLLKLLLSVHGCGVLAMRIKDDPSAVLASYVDRWDVLLGDGRLGIVFREIDSLPESLNDEKPFLRVHALHRAGLNERAVAIIENELQINANLSPSGLVKLARVAEDAGSSSLAKRLLMRAVEHLTCMEELKLALATASDVNDPELESRIETRLEAGFPDAPILSRRRAERLLAKRRYREAAAALADALVECVTQIAH